MPKTASNCPGVLVVREFIQSVDISTLQFFISAFAWTII